MSGLKSHTKATYKIEIYTPGMEFSADVFNGLYVHGVAGTDESIKIIDSAETDTSMGSDLYFTELTLGRWFETEPDSTNELGTSPLSNESKTIWYFEIIDFETAHIVSNGAINAFMEADSGAQVEIRYWDKDLERYEDISDMLNLSSLTDIDDTDYPGVKITSKLIDIEGNIIKLFIIKPTKITMPFEWYALPNFGSISNDLFPGDGDTTADHPNLYDVDQNTDYTVEFNTNSGGEFWVYGKFRLYIPDIERYNFSNIMVAFDYSLENDSAASSVSWSADRYYRAYDFMNRRTDVISNPDVDYLTPESDQFDPSEVRQFNEIPKIYYNETGVDRVYNNIADGLDISSFFSSADVGLAYPSISVRFQLIMDFSPFVVTVNMVMREITVIGEKFVNVINDDIYVKVRGEET